jgi:ribosomal protein S18 acetylase RimI-like enzyme
MERVTPPVHVDLCQGETARRFRRDVEDVVAAAFAGPPYFKTAKDIRATFGRFDSQTRKGGFLLSAGHVGDRLVGAAYGYPLGPDTGWWNDVLEPVLAELAFEDGRRSFAAFELAVRPEWQRRGVGRAVHDRLIRGLRAQRVILNCRPDAEAAQAFYRACGYQRVTSVIPWEGAPVYDVMVLDLRSTRSHTGEGQ